MIQIEDELMSGMDFARAIGVGHGRRQETSPAFPTHTCPDKSGRASRARPYSAIGLALLLLGLDALATGGAVELLFGALPAAPTGSQLRLSTIAQVAAMAAIVGSVIAGGSARDAIGVPIRQLLAGFAGGVAAVLAALATVALLGSLTMAFLAAARLLPLLPQLALIRMGAAMLLLADPRRRLFPRVVVLGNRETAWRLLRQAGGDQCPIRMLGQMDDSAPPGRDPDGLCRLGPTDAIFCMVRKGMVDTVIVASPWSDDHHQRALLRRLADCPVRVVMPVALAGDHFPGCSAVRIGGLDLVLLAEGPANGWRQAAKRAIDVVGSIVFGLAGVPLFLLIAVAIRLDSRGPILFRQRRTGFNDCIFTILKFRTMADRNIPNADDERRQALRGDARVTRVGRWLRATSLDELPQLLNVVRGEMSLVGPRPHAPGTRAGDRPFERVVARYAARHRVRPGLTGLAQVRGLRGETATEDRLVARIEADLEYIENWSLVRDAVILARTLWTVAAMTNAH